MDVCRPSKIGRYLGIKCFTEVQYTFCIKTLPAHILNVKNIELKNYTINVCRPSDIGRYLEIKYLTEVQYTFCKKTLPAHIIEWL